MAAVIRKRAVIARSVVDSANRNDDLKDLYVFGYQCTLFRDDEKALYIDQGKHLIPWMGNDNLMIDRSVDLGSVQVMILLKVSIYNCLTTDFCAIV
jgi:Alternative splicing regulator